MTILPYKVYVIVDRNFGERLASLEKGVPVWIVDTPRNKPVAQRLWQEWRTADHLSGITTFDDINSTSPEELFLAELDTIDLHHGSNSATPRYTILEVVGSPLTSNIERTLDTYGFNEFREGAVGFTAKRPEPED